MYSCAIQMCPGIPQIIIKKINKFGVNNSHSTLWYIGRSERINFWYAGKYHWTVKRVAEFLRFRTLELSRQQYAKQFFVTPRKSKVFPNKGKMEQNNKNTYLVVGAVLDKIHLWSFNPNWHDLQRHLGATFKRLNKLGRVSK